MLFVKIGAPLTSFFMSLIFNHNSMFTTLPKENLPLKDRGEKKEYREGRKISTWRKAL